MDTTGTGRRQFRFETFTLDVDRGALLTGGAETRLRRQSFDVLRYLVERRGRLVTRDELLSAIWGQAIVTDGSLTQCLIDIRRAIGDDSKQMIRTVPRRGYIFDAPVSEADPAAAEPDAMSPRIEPLANRRRWAAAVVILLVAGAIAWWVPRSDAPVEATTGPWPNSIAVLPFSDLSRERDQGYFSDGIAEEVLNLLARVPELRVIARTSSFAFKGEETDIATIAERLNVAYVLEGSVRRSGDHVRITAQLIDAATSAHVWSEVYDHKAGDVLALQEEIALQVAESLRVELSHVTAAGTGVPDSAEAYEAYLQGRFFHNRRGPGDSERAASNFRRALQIDPDYGRAWAGLAGTWLIRIAEEGVDTEANREAWREAAERALQHASELAEAQVRAAQYYYHEGDRARALQHLKKASALNPNHPLVLGGAAGDHLSHGRIGLAIDYAQRTAARDPLSAIAHGNLAQFLSAAGRFEEALVEFHRAMDLSPASDNPRFGIAEIYILQSRFDEALQLVQQLPDGAERDRDLVLIHQGLGRTGESDAVFQRLMSRSDTGIERVVAEVYARFGETDESLKWLLQGRLRVPDVTMPITQWLVDVHGSPFLIPLRDDARWREVTAGFD